LQSQSRYSYHYGFSSCHCSAKHVFRSLAASFGAVNDGTYRVFSILLLFLNLRVSPGAYSRSSNACFGMGRRRWIYSLAWDGPIPNNSPSRIAAGSFSGTSRQTGTSVRCWRENLCNLHLLFVFMMHLSLSLTQDAFAGMLAKKQSGANQIRQVSDWCMKQTFLGFPLKSGDHFEEEIQYTVGGFAFVND